MFSGLSTPISLLSPPLPETLGWTHKRWLGFAYIHFHFWFHSVPSVCSILSFISLCGYPNVFFNRHSWKNIDVDVLFLEDPHWIHLLKLVFASWVCANICFPIMFSIYITCVHVIMIGVYSILSILLHLFYNWTVFFISLWRFNFLSRIFFFCLKDCLYEFLYPSSVRIICLAFCMSEKDFIVPPFWILFLVDTEF